MKMKLGLEKLSALSLFCFILWGVNIWVARTMLAFTMLAEPKGIVFVINFLLLLFMLFLALNASKRHLIDEIKGLVRFRFDRTSKSQTIIVIILVLVFFPWLFLSWYYNFERVIQADSFSVVGAYYSLIGAAVASLIYIRISTKTITLKDFLATTINLIDNAKPNDEIIILTPTLFLGHEYYLKQHEKFKKVLFNKIKKNVKFTIYGLKLEKSYITKINNFIVQRDDPLEFPDIQGILYEDCPFNAKDKIHELHEGVTLIDMHLCYYGLHAKYQSDVKGDSNLKERKKRVRHYIEFFKFYSSLRSFENVSYHPLDFTYFYEDGKDPQNFFAVANTTVGEYYMGEFEVLSSSEQNFHGDSFRNDKICTHIKNMLESFSKANKSKTGISS